MTRKKSAECAGSDQAFPYNAYWEEIGDQWVTIEYLVRYTEEYVAFSKISAALGLDVPNPQPEEFVRLAGCFDLSSEKEKGLAAASILIAGWFLAPQRRKAMRVDLATVRQVLKRFSKLSRELYELSGKIPGQVEAMMDIVREVQSAAFETTGPGLSQLSRGLHDLSLAADRMIAETAPCRTGRRQEFVRDTTIRLAIEAASWAGLNDLVISRGTNSKPVPSLNGRAGHFLKGFFALVAPNHSETSLTPAIERVRRKMRP